MEVLINIIGGVALLLWGIRMVRTGVTRSFGAELRRALALSARSRVGAFFAGLGVTTAIQSATATAVIVSSFASQNLVPSIAALAMMLGADVGTAIVVQILTFDVSFLSPALIAIGVFTFLGNEKARRRNLGRIAIGLGLVLLSLKLIVLASVPLRETEIVAQLMYPLSSEPVLAVVIVALLTWLSHSSVAVILLTASLAATQVIGVQFALYLVLGANLGGAITAYMMTSQSGAVGRAVTLGNLGIRATGVLIAMPLIPYVLPYLTQLSDVPERSVANFHLAFNLALAILFLPALGLVCDLVTKLIKPDPEPTGPGGPRYLDKGALDSPTVALSCAAREALRMGDIVREMLNSTRQVLSTNDNDMRKQVEAEDDNVDTLHEAIKIYLTQLSSEELDRDESARSIEIMSFTTNLEHIGDIIDKNLMELSAKKIKGRITFSDPGEEEISELHARVIANLDLAMSIFMSGDLESARKLLREKQSIRELERISTDSHFGRVSEGRPESIQSSALHLDVLRDLKRINSHLTSVAYPILERAGELASSRLVETQNQPDMVNRPLVRPEAE